MAKGLLHQMDGRASVEAMAGMSMAQPVGRDLGGEPGPLSRGFHDPVHGSLVERAAALAGAEHRSVWLCAVCDRAQGGPGAGREEHDPGLAALAVNRDLSGPVARSEIAPRRPVTSEMRKPAP